MCEAVLFIFFHSLFFVLSQALHQKSSGSHHVCICMYLWICENTYVDVLVTRFPDIKILKHTHNLELVINILFSATTKQYL